MVSYDIRLGGKEFTCHGIIDRDDHFVAESIYIGGDVDDCLKFLGDYAEPLLLRLEGECTAMHSRSLFDANLERKAA